MLLSVNRSGVITVSKEGKLVLMTDVVANHTTRRRNMHEDRFIAPLLYVALGLPPGRTAASTGRDGAQTIIVKIAKNLRHP